MQKHNPWTIHTNTSVIDKAENTWISSGSIERIFNEEIYEQGKWKTIFPKMSELVNVPWRKLDAFT